MLQRVYVQNLITIETQVVDFKSGYTAVTGETGAGKSVVLKALGLILGDKGSKQLIRTDEKHLLVEGVFNIEKNKAAQEFLQNLEIHFDDELVIRRKINSSGKNTIFLNDFTSNLNQLASLGKLLIDFHGQHSQQGLMQSSTHIEYLDQFANIGEEKEQYRKIFIQYQEKKALKEQLDQDVEIRDKQLDFLEFQINELVQVNLSVQEDQSLRKELEHLSHREQLLQLIGPIADWSNAEKSTLTELSSALVQVEQSQDLDSALSPTFLQFQEGVIIIEDSIADLGRYLQDFDQNPARLDEINERLAEIEKVKMKHGGTVESALKTLEQFQQKHDSLLSLEENREEIEGELLHLKIQLQECAEVLTALRRADAPELETKILKELSELGLPQSEFQVKISSLQDEFRENGADVVDFFLTTNPGIPLSPLNKSASGGELSRVMLALKTVMNSESNPNIMVFDEIDTGISGRIAETVGYKMRQLSEDNQIICITHLAQIAALADFHLKVSKSVENQMTKTSVCSLTQEERVHEIAHFIAGAEITETSLSAAKEMLQKSAVVHEL
ncbi:MAG: DNA repair protein RecN (Recombination protein N) [bacterium]|jgi:DNA repair protein RecN (Recombination protein N)